MDMEVGENIVQEGQKSNSKTGNDLLRIWFFRGGQTTVQVDLSSTTLGQLKEMVVKDKESFTTSPSDIDILYNSKVLGNDEETLMSLGMKANRVVSIIRKIQRGKKPSGPTTEPTAMSVSEINQTAIALRTAFLNSNFSSIVDKMGEPEMLENIFVAAPGLMDDPVGIAIIQDLNMIFHISDQESLQKLAQTRPWVLEALNFLTAAIHTETGRGPQHGGALNHLFPMFGEDDMDEDDEEAALAQAQANNAPTRASITREQLSSALGSVSNFALFQPSSSVSQQRSIQIPPNTLGTPAGQSNPFQGLLQAAPRRATSSGAPSASSSDPSEVTAEAVARILRERLGQLPEEQRESGYNAFLQMAQRLANPSAQGQSSTASSLPQSQPQAQASSNPEAAQYGEQLAIMRSLGITDERLSIMALRVSDGDANLAADLILSGWTGEGFQ